MELLLFFQQVVQRTTGEAIEREENLQMFFVDAHLSSTLFHLTVRLEQWHGSRMHQISDGDEWRSAETGTTMDQDAIRRILLSGLINKLQNQRKILFHFALRHPIFDVKDTIGEFGWIMAFTS